MTTQDEDSASTENAHALAWLQASARGDRQAFERLYRFVHPRLVRFLGRFTTRRDLIDDVINDAMLIAWHKAAEFRGDSRVTTWLTGIAYRCMLKALRSGAPKEEIGESALEDYSLDSAPAAANDVAAHELRNWLARGLTTLTEDQRSTLVLAYCMGESCEDIAAIMGCAVGTVKARLFHARVRLRNVLPALGGTPEPQQATQG